MTYIFVSRYHVSMFGKNFKNFNPKKSKIAGTQDMVINDSVASLLSEAFKTRIEEGLVSLTSDFVRKAIGKFDQIHRIKAERFGLYRYYTNEMLDNLIVMCGQAKSHYGSINFYTIKDPVAETAKHTNGTSFSAAVGGIPSHVSQPVEHNPLRHHAPYSHSQIDIPNSDHNLYG